MYRDQLEKNWDHWKDKIRQKWPKLTHEDMKEIHGSYERLAHKLKQRHNVSQQDMDREFGHWVSQGSHLGQGSHGNQNFHGNQGPHAPNNPNKMRPGQDAHRRPDQEHGHKRENLDWSKKPGQHQEHKKENHDWNKKSNDHGHKKENNDWDRKRKTG